MHDEPMPDDVVLVIPFLEVMPADKHVAAIAAGRRVKGKSQTPNWSMAHGTLNYTSAPGTHWRRATACDHAVIRFKPEGKWSSGGYLKGEEDET